MSDGTKTLTRNKRLRWTLAGLIAGLALLVVLIQKSGATLSGISQVLGGVPWPIYALIMLTQSIIVVAAAMKWRIVLSETLDIQTISLGTATSATATGALLGQIISIQISVPIVRAWVASKSGIRARAAAGTSLFEQSLELLTLGIAVLAGLVFVALGAAFATFSLIVLLGVVVAALKPVLRGSALVVHRIRVMIGEGAALTSLADGLNQAADQRSVVLHKLMGLSLLRYVLIAGLNVGLMVMFLPGLDPMPLFVAFPLILLVSSIPFLPAGLGVTEVTWASALFLQGIDAATAAEAAVSLRIVTVSGFLLCYPLLAAAGFRRHQDL
ncbi:flippase-like domain-containing protein [Ruegeria conchae]|uniref:flippase-like domain-containing protein n=1 Tax=Ruegeria conchae TaxID=981384 RepID=UPI0021A585BC|nr:flippase-like domain-containing protein [Ruegeria conchae]